MAALPLLTGLGGGSGGCLAGCGPEVGTSEVPVVVVEEGAGCPLAAPRGGGGLAAMGGGGNGEPEEEE